MGMFGAIDRAQSGLTLMRTWMDAVSHNVANVNTVRSTDDEAFQAQVVLARSVGGEGNEPGSGVQVAGIRVLDDPEGRLVHDPDHPLADEEGYVRHPSVDLGDQLVQLMAAQRAYQANLSVVDRARDSYLAALQLGK